MARAFAPLLLPFELRSANSVSGNDRTNDVPSATLRHCKTFGLALVAIISDRMPSACRASRKSMY